MLPKTWTSIGTRLTGSGSLLGFARDFARYSGNRLVPAMVLLFLGALIEGVGLILLLPLLSVVFEAGSGSGLLDGVTAALLSLMPGASPFWQIAFLLGLFALVMAIRGAVIIARDLHLARLQVGFVESRRTEIIRLLARARWEVVARLRHGRITHVLGEDVQATGFAAQLLLQGAILFAMLLIQFALLILLSPLLALFGAGLGLIVAVTLQPALRRARDLGAKFTGTQLELTNSATQFLGGLKLAMSQNLQQSYVRAFEDTIEDAARHQVAFARQRVLTQIALSTTIAGAAGASILVGVGLLETAPTLMMAFLFILARMSGAAVRAQTSLQHIFHTLPAYEKLKELAAELRAGGSADVELPAGSAGVAAGALEFRHVSFRHARTSSGSDAPAGVDDISVAIMPGEFVGLTGPSGAGKTTFVDLLVGLYTPQSGEIAIGGNPLRGELLWHWRERISYISQDSFLFHDTIRNNLLWAQPRASEDELWEALGLAGADALVRRMEQGLETVVGERGALLSGGERQRIALARALLRRPALLVLDEATSAVDPETERGILERILGFEPRPTILMVAHRDESLRLCSRIIRVEAGRLVAPGAAGSPN